jgi:aspartate/methionine/tyrosine aminotransferase
VFSQLESQPADALLAVMAAFAADPSSEKLDLGVGVYRDESGVTPVMRAVREAEAELLTAQKTKAYVGPAGNRPFADFIETLTLGDHPARRAGRVVTLQTPGGCGALRLAADLINRAARGTRIAMSDPTWANHVPLLSGAGLVVDTYPYYDAQTGSVSFEPMLETLKRLPAGAVVLLHGACHNPTGADLSLDQWQVLAGLLETRGLVPLIDIAYQGLGEGLDQDAAGLRLLAQQLPELLIAVSCSKNFGLYRERVGAIIAIGESPSQASILMSHLQALARRMYSMSPDHGAAIVAAIGASSRLSAEWRVELDIMRERVARIRHAVTQALNRELQSERFDFIAAQRGMFSVLGLDSQAVSRLRSEHHVYLANDSRMNLAGLPESAVGHFAGALAKVIHSG